MDFSLDVTAQDNSASPEQDVPKAKKQRSSRAYVPMSQLARALMTATPQMSGMSRGQGQVWQ